MPIACKIVFVSWSIANLRPVSRAIINHVLTPLAELEGRYRIDTSTRFGFWQPDEKDIRFFSASAGLGQPDNQLGRTIASSISESNYAITMHCRRSGICPTPGLASRAANLLRCEKLRPRELQAATILLLRRTSSAVHFTPSTPPAHSS